MHKTHTYSNTHWLAIVSFLMVVGFLSLVDPVHASYTYNSGCGATNDNGSSYSVTCFASTQNNNGGGNIDDTSTVTVWVPGNVDPNGIYVSTAYARDTGYYSGPGFNFSVGSCGSGNTCGGTINAHVSANSTFSANIRRIGPNGYARAELTFIMPKITAPTISTFTASPATIAYNTPSSLSWNASGTGLDYCEASNGWSGNKTTSGSNVSTGNLTTTTTFSLRCHGAGGWSSVQNVTVNVSSPSAPIIAIFTASPATVAYNTPTSLSWNATGVGVDYCTASNGWTGQKAISGSNVSTGNLTTTTMFSLQCHGTGGLSSVQSVTVNVLDQVVPVPTISNFSVNPTTVSYNSPTYLSWNTSGNADYCEASNGWSGQKSTSGSNVSTGNLTSTTTFSLRCHGTGGWSSTQSVTVNVLDQVVLSPTITNFSVNAVQVPYNTPVYLSWNTSGNVSYCQASNGWNGQLAASGSNIVTQNITGTTSFTLSCYGPGGWSPSQTVTVGVTTPSVPTITNFSVNAVQVPYNTPVYLSWNTSGNVSYCQASNGWNGQLAASGSNIVTQNITGTTSFTLSCYGPGGWSPSQTVTVGVTSQTGNGLVVTFTANATSVAYNTPAYFSWNSVGANYCEASNGWSGIKATSGSDIATQNLTGTTSFSIRCYGGGNWSPHQTVTINVASVSTPTISSFLASPSSVSYNTPAYLSWNTSGDADYCEASNGWSGQKPVNGSVIATQNLTTTTTFSLRCHGAGGWSAYQNVSVNVNAPVSVSLAYIAPIAPTVQKPTSVVAPSIKLACNPSTCVGYQGVAVGGAGSLSITSAPQNGAYVSCVIQVDNEKQKTIPCDKNLSMLVSDRKVGTHTFTLTNTHASGKKNKRSISFRIKDNIKPKLVCSFDAITWKPCKEIQPTVGIGIYVRDSSLPSTGARITSRRLQAIPGIQPGVVTAELALFKPVSSGVKLIQLSVVDSAGRVGNVVDLLYVKEGPAIICTPVETLSKTK